MSLRPGHGSRYVGSGAPSTRAAGGWAKKAPREGEVVKHPTKEGKWVARQMFFTDSTHDSQVDAMTHLEKRKQSIASIKAGGNL